MDKYSPLSNIQDFFPRDTRSYWYNQVTKQHDYRGFPTTDEEVVQYISQDRAVQGVYRAYRAMGKSVMYAFTNTLRACVGEPADESIP